MIGCVGIDCGFTHLTVALLDVTGNMVAIESAREPAGNGHDKHVALARLRNTLEQLRDLRNQPVDLAGYCYNDSGVREAFLDAEWTVVDSVPLNDVVGVYGLTEMRGHVLVGGCGSYSQIVYIDRQNNVCWPADDLMGELPTWLLCGDEYSKFMQGAYAWPNTGRLLSETIHLPPTQEYLRRAAKAVRETRDVLWRHLDCDEPPRVVLGGGAVRDARLWERLDAILEEFAVKADRVVGTQAVGLARSATLHRKANAWAYIGDRPPSWLG